MIAYLSTAAHAYTIQWLIQPDGWVPELQDTIVPYSYEQLLQPRPQPLFDTYIFTDLERLDLPMRQRLAQVWEQLAALKPAPRLLNHPLRVKRRLELLNTLYQAGINTFDAYPIPARGYPTPRRFPVFVRQADNHDGPVSALLHSQAELNREIDTLRALRELDSASIVTEFLDNRTADGLYYKYGTFCVGERIIANHIQSSEHWMVKRSKTTLTQALIDRELDFMRTNPDQDLIRSVFKFAAIDFGRIDYTWADGRIQVFEINTNPTTLYPRAPADIRDPCRALFAKLIDAAFRALNTPLETLP